MELQDGKIDGFNWLSHYVPDTADDDGVLLLKNCLRTEIQGIFYHVMITVQTVSPDKIQHEDR